MAQGDFKLFREFSDLLCGASNSPYFMFDGPGTGLGIDSANWYLALSSVIPTEYDINTRWDGIGNEWRGETANFVITTYTEVAGTGYTSGGLQVTPSAQSIGGFGWRWDLSDLTWATDPAGPADIRSALLYYRQIRSSGGNSGGPIIGYIDMTPDGSSPISLRSSDITITWNPSGVFEVGF